MKTKEYNKIYDHIKHQILSSSYAAGQKLPAERVLCEQFNVSRITARHALRLLADEGLVERFQGKGTFVKNIKPAKLPITELGFARSVKTHAPGLYRKLLKNKSVKPPRYISKFLNLDSEKCFHAVRADVLDDQTIAFDKVYIRLEHCRSITEELLIRVDYFEKWIKSENLKICYNSETIEAIEADSQAAAILNVKAGSPILKAIEVHYDVNNKPVAVFESYYHGDRVKLTSTISFKGKTNVKIHNNQC